MIGLYGIIFALFFLPAVALCMASKKYAVVGFILGISWLAYLAPIREILPVYDGPIYFVAVETITALALIVFAKDLVLAKIITGLIGFLILVGYMPLYLDLISTYHSMVIADIIGAIQICAMYGAAGGHIYRNRFANRHHLRRASNLGLFRVPKSGGSDKVHNGPFQG